MDGMTDFDPSKVWDSITPFSPKEVKILRSLSHRRSIRQKWKRNSNLRLRKPPKHKYLCSDNRRIYSCKKRQIFVFAITLFTKLARPIFTTGPADFYNWPGRFYNWPGRFYNWPGWFYNGFNLGSSQTLLRTIGFKGFSQFKTMRLDLVELKVSIDRAWSILHVYTVPGLAGTKMAF